VRVVLVSFAFISLTFVSLTQAQDKMQAPKKGKHPAHAASGSTSFKGEVQKMADDWKNGFKSKDVAKVAGMYSDDAVWITVEGTFHGAGEIKSQLQKMADRGDTVEDITTAKAVHFGDIGYAEGSFSGKAPDQSGAEKPAQGTWVVSLKNVNGKWMIATHTSVPGSVTSKSGKKSE